MEKDKFLDFIYDPNLVQNKSLTLLDKALQGKLDITDPTNPFIFLLENSALLTSSFAKNVEVAMRDMYPILSTRKEHLYKHLNSTEIVDIFAKPSKALFNILINKRDIETYGAAGDGYYEIILPKFTTITVNDIVFTLLNDILVRYYSHNKVFSKIMFSELDIAVKTNDVLDSRMVKDNDNNDWIMISLELSQLKKFSIRDNLVVGYPFKKIIKLDEKFSFIEARSIFKYSNEIAKLDVTLSNFVYDPNKPTIIVQPREGDVLLEIPPVYTDKNLLTNFIELDLYTTLGELYLNLNKYKPDDFVMDVNVLNSSDPRQMGINSINYVITGNGETYGGSGEPSFEELKAKIINYSTGDNDLPITDDELNDYISKKGFTLSGKTDSLFKRNYLITKHIYKNEYDLYANMDIYTDRVKIFYPNVNSSKIFKRIDSFIIEPYQVFEKRGTTLVPLTDIEMETVKKQVENDISAYNKRNLFFNIYKYVIDFEEALKVRVYEVNAPLVYNIETTFNNNKLVSPLIVDETNISKTDEGYKLYLKINNDTAIKALDISKVSAQLKIHLEEQEYAYFKGSLQLIGEDIYIILNLLSDGYIDKDNKILLKTLYGNISTPRIDILSGAEISIYTTEEIDLLNNEIDVTEIITDTATSILYKENLTIEFGKYLNNIFSTYNMVYRDRRFKTYDKETYLTYKEDIYELDDNGLVKLKEIDTDGDGFVDNVEPIIKYKKGDFVLDADGNKIPLHKKGDIILDDTGSPIIDTELGIEHYVSMLLLDDCFIRANDEEHREYRLDYFMELTNTIYNNIKDLNKNLLENTEFKFISYSNCSDVSLVESNKITTYPNFIEPEVILYIDKGSDFVLSSEIEKTITSVLQYSLLTNTTISIIESNIEEALGDDVLSVKLKDTGNIEVNSIIYSKNSSKFTIKKGLFKLDTEHTIVKPVIKINIITI